MLVLMHSLDIVFIGLLSLRFNSQLLFSTQSNHSDDSTPDLSRCISTREVGGIELAGGCLAGKRYIVP